MVIIIGDSRSRTLHRHAVRMKSSSRSGHERGLSFKARLQAPRSFSRVEWPRHREQSECAAAPRAACGGRRGSRRSPAALTICCVFHVVGRPISWPYFWREVWTPALVAAGLEHRAPYNLRHSYAMHTLQAGVPIASLARQMGTRRHQPDVRDVRRLGQRWEPTSRRGDSAGRKPGPCHRCATRGRPRRLVDPQSSTPNGIRTRVTALKGRGPRPLADGGAPAQDTGQAASSGRAGRRSRAAWSSSQASASVSA